MSETNDISRLFSRFGGHPDQYQEIGRDNLARSSEARWPLLVSVARQTATMQAHHDMDHAAPATDSPEDAAPAAGPRAFGEVPGLRPLAQVHPAINEYVAVPGSTEQGAAEAENKTPLAQFIPPRRRMSPPRAHAVPNPMPPPAQPSRPHQVQVRPEHRTADQGWSAGAPPLPPLPASSGRPEAVRSSLQSRPQSPLQAIFARLERAGENGGFAAQSSSEAPGTRASIFERLARR